MWNDLNELNALEESKKKLVVIEVLENDWIQVELKKTTLLEISWRQKFRVLWLRKWDRNTEFFHQIANLYRRNNSITKAFGRWGVDYGFGHHLLYCPVIWASIRWGWCLKTLVGWTRVLSDSRQECRMVGQTVWQWRSSWGDNRFLWKWGTGVGWSSSFLLDLLRVCSKLI